MKYTPLPGTIPHRAIAHLKTLGEGAELATAVLCEEIGAQPNGFHACMLPAQRQGLVRATKKLRISYWSLGDGQAVVAGPAVDADGEDRDEHRGSNHTAPTHAEMLLSAWGKPAQGDPVGAEEMADAVASSAAVPENKPAAPMAASALEHPAPPTLEEVFQAVARHRPPILVDDDEPDAFAFACALWSDGRLQLQLVDEEMVLSVEQTRALVTYLDRMRVEA